MIAIFLKIHICGSVCLQTATLYSCTICAGLLWRCLQNTVWKRPSPAGNGSWLHTTGWKCRYVSHTLCIIRQLIVKLMSKMDGWIDWLIFWTPTCAVYAWDGGSVADDSGAEDGIVFRDQGGGRPSGRLRGESTHTLCTWCHPSLPVDRGQLVVTS